MKKGTKQKNKPIKKSQYTSTNVMIEERKEDKNNDNEIDISGFLFKITSIIMFAMLLAFATRIMPLMYYKKDHLIEISLCLMIFYFIYELTTNGEKFNIIKLILRFVALIPTYDFLNRINLFGMDSLSSEYTVSNILYLYISFFIVTCRFNIYEKLIGIINFIFDFLKTCEYPMGLLKIYFLYLYMILPITFIMVFCSQYFLMKDNFETASKIMQICYTVIMIFPAVPLTVFMYKSLCKKDLKVRGMFLNYIFNKKNKIIDFQEYVYKILNKDKSIETPSEAVVFEKIKVKKEIDFTIKTYIRYAMPITLILYYFCFGNYLYPYAAKNEGYCTNLNKKDLIVKLQNDNKVLKLNIAKEPKRVISIDDEDCNVIKKNRKTYNPYGN